MKDKKPVTKVITALFARTQFGQILRKVKDNKARYIVGKRGEPQAVIMGIQDFINTIAPEPEFLTLLGKASQKRGTDKLTMDEINAEIAAVRRSKQPANAA